jgi:hypothetical protein
MARKNKTPVQLACIREACRTGDCLDFITAEWRIRLDLLLFRCFLFGFFLSSHSDLLARVENEMLCLSLQIVNLILKLVLEITYEYSLSLIPLHACNNFRFFMSKKRRTHRLMAREEVLRRIACIFSLCRMHKNFLVRKKAIYFKPLAVPEKQSCAFALFHNA